MRNEKTEYDGDQDTRLSRLEAIVENLALEVRDLKEIMVASGKTNWNVLASWAAVILAIISIGASGYISDLSNLEKKMDEITARQIEMRVIEARMEERLHWTLKEADHHE